MSFSRYSRLRGTGSLLFLGWLLALPGKAQPLPVETVQGYLWPESAEEFQRAQKELGPWRTKGLSRDEFARLEQILRAGPPRLDPPPPAPADPAEPLELTAESPNGPIPLLVRLPPGYSGERAWPLLVAMHGGPPGSAEQALRGAVRMLSVWNESAAKAGWMVVAPAMVSTVSVDEYTQERLPYEIFHPEDFAAVIDRVGRQFRIDHDRIVSTGISLGSNFSIAFGASHPDWLAAIVPVSTEGDSRQGLLKNFFNLPVYVLEGTQDRNIRTISGPRALAGILAREAYDFVYLEMSDRAHEGFTEHYPDVLRWLAGRPRQLYPKRVLRSPHAGIVPLSRRIYWVGSESAEGMIEARIASPNRIEMRAWNTPRVDLYLHDRLLDLDSPIEVAINGKSVFRGAVQRSALTALDEIRSSGDPGRVFAAHLTVEVPRDEQVRPAGERLAASLKPATEPGQLSFWEMYAARSLDERFPDPGLKVSQQLLPAELAPFPSQRGLQVQEVPSQGPLAALRRGDLIVGLGAHLFFAEADHDWLFQLRRDLRGSPQSLALRVWRDGRLQELTVPLALGDYAHRRGQP